MADLFKHMPKLSNATENISPSPCLEKSGFKLQAGSYKVKQHEGYWGRSHYQVSRTTSKLASSLYFHTTPKGGLGPTFDHILRASAPLQGDSSVRFQLSHDYVEHELLTITALLPRSISFPRTNVIMQSTQQLRGSLPFSKGLAIPEALEVFHNLPSDIESDESSLNEADDVMTAKSSSNENTNIDEEKEDI
ncbi:hypothetical protein TNCV_5105941 [Trichonephila clavipes]|nr:hypothetical protein TNCV_5105941 [Trichonephila clavipes]